MTRSGLAFGILLGVAGCGPVGSMYGGGMIEARPLFGPRGSRCGAHSGSHDGSRAWAEAPAGGPLWLASRAGVLETDGGHSQTELTDAALRSLPATAGELRSTSAAPDCVRVPGAALGLSRTGGGRGYVWVGYTVADIGQDGLSRFGRGDGFSFGGGFKLGEAGHTFFEFAWEKSLKHEVDPAITTTSSALHERQLVGFRTTTTPRARLQNQPRPYVSYGLGYNVMRVQYDSGPGTTAYFPNGVGPYVGFGCEFPSEGRGSFSFDMKRHFWEDVDPHSTLAFSLLWMNRF